MALPGFLRRRPYLLGTVEVDPSRLPTTVALKAPVVAGAALVVFGAVWTALTLNAVWPAIGAEGLPAPFLLAFLAFPAIGLLTALAGVAMLTGRLTARFGPEGVAVEERGPLGRRQWSAAYTAFEGVRMVERRQRRRKRRDILWQIVELRHPDPRRTLPLLVRRGDDPPRAEWEAAARALGVPALVDGPDGTVARDTASLDRSLKERAAAGETVSAWSADRPVPAGLAVEREETATGPRLVVTVRRLRLPLWLAAMAGLFGLALAAAGFAGGEPAAALVLPFAGLAILGGTIVVVGLDRRRPRRLFVTRTAIRVDDPLSWLADRGPHDRLALGDIEEIRLDRNRGRRRVLAIEGDRGRIVAGAGLRAGELVWLRDFLAAAVAQA